MARPANLALSLVGLILLLHVSGDVAAQGPVQTFEGVLTILWGDPPPDSGGGGDTRYTLVQADGTTLRLQLAGQEAAAIRSFGRRITVTGRAVEPQAASASAVIAVDTIASSRSESLVAPQAVTGTRRVIFLLARFADDATVPHPPSFYVNLTNPDTPPAGEVFPATVNAFFKRASFGQFSWVAEVGGVGGVGAPGGWMTLPGNHGDYCSLNACDTGLQRLMDDSMALGRANGINFRDYDNISFVTSNELGCCAYGGGLYSSIDDKFFGITLTAPGAQHTQTLAHEMGHSLGLPHSGWVYSPYDSPWDEMSGGWGLNAVICGSYFSRSLGRIVEFYCFEPTAGYITAHKDTLGWIPPSNQVVVNPHSIVTVSLEGNGLPLSSAPKMIRICLAGLPCTGDAARFFTVEARVRAQFDNLNFREGVVIHDVRLDRPPISGPCFWNSTSGWALPVDSTPGDWDAMACGPGSRQFPDYALYNSQWTVGQTHINTTHGLRISVVSRTGSTFLVTVANAAAPSIEAHPTSQTIAPSGLATLSVTAAGVAPFAYQWYRGPAGVTTNPIAGATSGSYTTAPSTSTSRYWVRVSNSEGAADSTAATVTVAFTDNVLTSGVSVVRASHVTELRVRIGALRARFGLTAFPWTDQPIAPGSMSIRLAHVAELRAALQQAFTAAGIPPPSFTDPVLTGGVTPVRRVHIEEIRGAVHVLESS